MRIFKPSGFIWLFVVLVFTGSISAATVDGIPIHYSTHGQGARTVILVHGWTCDETTWQSHVPDFSKRYRVITLDLPGHGKSGSPKDGKLSMDLFARASHPGYDGFKDLAAAAYFHLIFPRPQGMALT